MEAMWDKLSLVRVYTKPKGKQPDYSQPVVLRASRCTVEDFVGLPISSIFSPLHIYEELWITNWFDV
jgi:ribosome-interacting GTPase 1